MMPAYKENYTHYTTPSGNTQIFVYHRKAKKRMSKREKYQIQQKFLGLILTVLGIIGCFFVPEDCGGFLFAVLLGIARMISN